MAPPFYKNVARDRIGAEFAAIALASRSHRDPATDAFLVSVPHVQIESVGSSLKFCRIAAGRADLYPRFDPTMEWDVAAS